MNYQRSPLRQLIFRALLYFAIAIFVFDVHFYRYGVDVRLGQFMHAVAAQVEREASQHYNSWRASL